MAEDDAENNCRQLGRWTTKRVDREGSREARWHGSCWTPERCRSKQLGSVVTHQELPGGNQKTNGRD